MAYAWIETYYPDVGWVASDPQTSENYIDTSHIVMGFNQCQTSGTVINQTARTESVAPLYSLKTPYGKAIWYGWSAARVLGWDRFPLRVTPSAYFALLAMGSPIRTISFQVQNNDCSGSGGWSIESKNPWVTPGVVSATVPGPALFTVNGTGMPKGAYSAALTAWGLSPFDVISRTIPVNLRLVDQVFTSFLPFAVRGR